MRVPVAIGAVSFALVAVSVLLVWGDQVADTVRRSRDVLVGCWLDRRGLRA